ncbi:MAG: spore coat protein [Oscillospiraceae bacterium]|nr:spore coat protein [Oscillospiraceae bacterium]
MQTPKKSTAKKSTTKKSPTKKPAVQGFTMSDREIMEDILASQKHIVGIYNTFSCECVNQQLKSDFLSHWKNNQNLQSNVFSQMQQRGWYAPKKAQQKAVDQTKTKFQGIQQQLP